MSLLWFFQVEKSLGEFFPHYEKDQGELDIDYAES